MLQIISSLSLQLWLLSCRAAFIRAPDEVYVPVLFVAAKEGLNVSDLYHNPRSETDMEFPEQEEVHSSLDEIGYYRSCFLDGWLKKGLDVDQVRLNLTDDNKRTVVSMRFLSSSADVKDWFNGRKETSSTLLTSDMPRSQYTFSFRKNNATICVDLGRRRGKMCLFQAVWNSNKTEFLYATVYDGVQAPLKANGDTVKSASILSIEVFTDSDHTECQISWTRVIKSTQIPPSELTTQTRDVVENATAEINLTSVFTTTCTTLGPDNKTVISVVTTTAFMPPDTDTSRESIYSQLIIPKKSTLLYKRTLGCAEDSRTSSQALGLVAIAVITCTVGFLILVDLTSIRRYGAVLKCISQTDQTENGQD